MSNASNAGIKRCRVRECGSVRVSENLWRALAEVNDPEFPMSVVDLGLIYGVAQEKETVNIKITFTAMGCPAMDMILDDIRVRLLQEPNVRNVQFEIVWDPPWNKSRLSDHGRELLKMWGIAV
ncbi:MAG: metal-sulfur cluster assembly factor [Chloroflexi bacterium]|nr:metal-sulfur cluster assembly factor [Chloroflexota bacterium]